MEPGTQKHARTENPNFAVSILRCYSEEIGVSGVSEVVKRA